MQKVSESVPIFIDSDNALGSPFGDIDDGFALAALMKSQIPIIKISTIFGNTSEPLAYRNTQQLAKICGFKGAVIRGAATRWAHDSEAARELASYGSPLRILALGPMTNIALALNRNSGLPNPIQELVFLGTNFSVPLPAWRFFDFNQWKDPKSFRTVFDSKIKLTFIPCNIARRLRITRYALNEIPGELGVYLRLNSTRWFRRARFLKRTQSVPVWDLVAALYMIDPKQFNTIDTAATLGRRGDVTYGLGEARPVEVVVDFDPESLWQTFLRHC